MRPPDRSTPIIGDQFRGAMLMGQTNSGHMLLMIARDYDLMRAKLDAALGPSSTPMNTPFGNPTGLPDFPWFYRKRQWMIESRGQFDYMRQHLMQDTGAQGQTFPVERLLLIEVDFDKPLHPSIMEE